MDHIPGQAELDADSLLHDAVYKSKGGFLFFMPPPRGQESFEWTEEFTISNRAKDGRLLKIVHQQSVRVRPRSSATAMERALLEGEVVGKGFSLDVCATWDSEEIVDAWSFLDFAETSFRGIVDLSGRPTARFSLRTPSKETGDKAVDALRSVEATLWIDVEDRRLVKVESRYAQTVPMSRGFLVSSFHAQGERFFAELFWEDGAWLPLRREVHTPLNRTWFFGAKRYQAYRCRFFDFKRVDRKETSSMHSVRLTRFAAIERR